MPVQDIINNARRRVAVQDAAYPKGDETTITGFHAHVYYDEASRADAARLRTEAWEKWPDRVEMGRFRDGAVGPHPVSMYQIGFARDLFDEMVPWLMYNRRGLNILVHPEAEDAFDDHAFYPLWLGDKLDLRLEWLRKGIRSA